MPSLDHPLSLGSSPHTRGARPSARGYRARRPDHPRIRGEHHAKAFEAWNVQGSSPHTRGAPRQSIRGVERAGIIPAYAGSTISRRPCGPEDWDHPRIRGEHQLTTQATQAATGSSPHTRGARSRLPSGLWCVRIIPAYAGSTSAAGRRARPRADHPRIRGEHSTRPTRSPGRTDHPRIRGEHMSVTSRRSCFWGSSPHTRGARACSLAVLLLYRIIPAYAGSTSMPNFTRLVPPDHPRIRGEHAGLDAGKYAGLGSSPHTRGAPGRGSPSSASWRIIPAYAGSTVPGFSVWTLWWDHPRIRGEHQLCRDISPDGAGSSPHTRGAHPVRLIRRRGIGIIPAYAGSTALDFQAGLTWRDHPRIRGEHLQLMGFHLLSSGSSPHTRGARASPCPRAARDRIIPAYAGST